MKVSVVSIGPGDPKLIPEKAKEAVQAADTLIGYSYYLDLVRDFLSGEQELISKAIGSEKERADLAFERAEQGKKVAVISSGDAGIYAMGGLVYEEAAMRTFQGELETIPGVTAFTAAAAKVGAPIGHDFCSISLSDRLTPWATIENRIQKAAEADFVTALYNPRSEHRYWQLARFRELYLQVRNPRTPVAIIRQVDRPEEAIELLTLEGLDADCVDMFSIVLVGNSQSFRFGDKLVTPRGYHQPAGTEDGAAIQAESFAHILSEMEHTERPTDELWAILRCIHSTGDPAYENFFRSSEGAIAEWAKKLKEGMPVVTDVEMVRSGISQKLREKFGTKVLCYLNDPDIAHIVSERNITRSKAAMERAMEDHPDALFVVGNAPTALNAIADGFKTRGFEPAGVIGAPVGFVNVKESKERLKACKNLHQVIISGTRGGSNVAASIVNAALTLDEAEDRLEHLKTQNGTPLWSSYTTP